jgi:hypothetical protein
MVGRHEQIFATLALVVTDDADVGHESEIRIVHRAEYARRDVDDHGAVLEIDAQPDIDHGGIRRKE